MLEEDNISFLTAKLVKKEKKIKDLKDEIRKFENRINDLEMDNNGNNERKVNMGESDWFLNEVAQIFGDTLKSPRELLDLIKCSKYQASQLERNDQISLVNRSQSGDNKNNILKWTNREKELELALEEKETIVQRLKNQMKKKEHELNELKEEMEQIENQKPNQSSKIKLKKLKQSQITMNETIEEKESEINQKNRKLKEYDERIAINDVKLNDVKEELRIKENDNRKLQDQLSKEKINCQSMVEKHLDEVRELDNERKEIKEHLEKKCDALKVIKGKFRKSEEDLEMKEEKYLDLELEKKATENQYKQKMDDMKDELNAKNKTLETVNKELKTSDYKICKLTENLHQYENDVKEEKEKYDKLDGLYNTAKANTKDKEEIIESLEKELKEMKQKIDIQKKNCRPSPKEPEWWKQYQIPADQITPNMRKSFAGTTENPFRKSDYENDKFKPSKYRNTYFDKNQYLPQQPEMFPNNVPYLQQRMPTFK